MLLVIYISIGLVLGPSFLNLSGNEALFSFCAQGFLLVAGLELSIRHLKQHLAGSLKIALGAFLFPFVVGMLAAPLLVGPSSSAVILALALSISALPVIVQILKDLKIYDTKVGHIAISAATVCDVLAWVIFLGIIPAEHRHAWLKSHGAVLLFFVGLTFSEWIRRFPRIQNVLLKLSQWFFAPVFFISVGMKIEMQNHFSWIQFLAVLILALFSKTAGVYFMARRAKYQKSESMVMAAVLNARGAMEILYASLALSLGMIDETLFTSLVLMAIVSSVIAVPFARRCQAC